MEVASSFPSPSSTITPHRSVMALEVPGTHSLLWWEEEEEGLLGEEESFVGSLNPATGDTYVTAQHGSAFPFGSLFLNASYPLTLLGVGSSA